MEHKTGSRNVSPVFRSVLTLARLLMITAALLLFTVVSCQPAEPPPLDAPQDTVTEKPLYDPDDLEAIFFPASPAPGDFTVITVGPLPADASVRVQPDFAASVSPLYQTGDYSYFILGIAFQVPPGVQRLHLSVEHPAGTHREIPVDLAISDAGFGTLSFRMPPGVTAGWSAQQLAEGRERVRRARGETTPEPLWHQPFILPLEGRISSPYGQVRIINQGAPSHHNGIDFAVPEGTPVCATNDGVVRLADLLLAHGNVVIIDHGLDLSSSYLHLETIAVTEGEKVSRGQVIGTVGETGFANGPHLHWEVNLGQAPVNPMQLVQGDLYCLPGRSALP